MSIAVLSDSGSNGKVRYHLKLHNTVFEIDEKYVIGKAIGYSAHGVLCSANNTVNDEKVAIEKITDLFKDVEEARRILRELLLLRSLKHPNILGIREIFEPADKELNDLYVVYDLMSLDLRELQRTPRLTTKHIQVLTYQLLCALKQIHAANVVHGDVRPSNILVDEEANLKLAKFGLALVGGEAPPSDYFDHLAQPHWYFAPEVLSRKGPVTSAADIWSAGAVLAEMLRGKPVITGRTEQEVQTCQADLTTTLPQLLSKAPAGGLDLVGKLLALDPAARLTAAAALEHPWLADVREPAAEATTAAPLASYNTSLDTLKAHEIKQQFLEEIKAYHPNMEV